MVGVDDAIARNVDEFVLVTGYRQQIEKLKIKVDSLTQRVSSLSSTVDVLRETIVSQRRRMRELLEMVCRLEGVLASHGNADDDYEWAPLREPVRLPLRAPPHLSRP